MIKLNTFCLSLFFYLLCLTAAAQQEPELTIALLANDKIAEVNLNQDAFIASVGEYSDLAKKEFKDVGPQQKVAILLIAHTQGNPTIEIYSNPKLAADKEASALKNLQGIVLGHTKYVDFPILFIINAKFEDLKTDFKDLVVPMDKSDEQYVNASLKEKYELNKAYAIKEALPILSAYETIVDDQFVGVKSFGKVVESTDFNKPQNISTLTSKNNFYWRASMEMSAGNQLIPVTKIALLLSQGEFDYALKYIEMIRLFCDPKAVPTIYLKEMARRLDEFNKQLNEAIDKGIAEHDKGNYEKAIAIYKDILQEYPNSASVQYELYYSQNALQLKNQTQSIDDRKDWDLAKVSIYKSNPLYTMDVRAANGKEGYLLFRRQSIQQLFKTKEAKLSDVYTYADIAMDLGVYDFAAQLFWLSSSFDKDSKDALSKYLYCLEKLGVTDLKENFKGDFEKEFKAIDKAKVKEMEQSSIYKSFKTK